MASMCMNTSDRVKSDLTGLQITANMDRERHPLCLHPVRSVLAQAGHCTHGGGFDLSALLCRNLVLFRASVHISCTVAKSAIHSDCSCDNHCLHSLDVNNAGSD